MSNKKIVSVEELIGIVGMFPRKKSVAMCHGTFDIVHPGHIRHLQYVKSQGDFLVASVTADEHINKGPYRPYVPEHLRAFNLASLEIVDFVIIDENSEPLENLKHLQPDIFVKGYEYQDTVNPKTQKESDIVTSYGGVMLFSPGDVIYSSSNLIDLAEPKLSNDKLVSLLESEAITFDDLRASIKNIKETSVHVIGDTIIDRQTICSPYGSSSKTPTLSVRFENQKDFVGGAAIVAKHLRAAGAKVTFSTIVGDDDAGRWLVDDLESNGITVNVLSEANRCTTIKSAIVSQNYRLLKVDHVDNRPISPTTSTRLAELISQTKTDVLIFSDFRHGIFNQQSIPTLCKAIPANAFTAADSQVATRWGNILDFQKFDLITPNEKEARFSLGDQDSVVRPLAKKLHKASGCKTLILKCGEKGIITYTEQSDDYRAFFAVDSFAEENRDSVGAGDALLAYSALCLSKTNNPLLSSVIGCVAAGLECEIDGNEPITTRLVEARLEKIEKNCNYEI